MAKMNVDTDTHYAFTRPVVAHMMSNYDGGVRNSVVAGWPQSMLPEGRHPSWRGLSTFLLRPGGRGMRCV